VVLCRLLISDWQNSKKLELHRSHSHHYELLVYLVTCLQSKYPGYLVHLFSSHECAHSQNNTTV
jgi:hypothetical protein